MTTKTYYIKPTQTEFVWMFGEISYSDTNFGENTLAVEVPITLIDETEETLHSFLLQTWKKAHEPRVLAVHVGHTMYWTATVMRALLNTMYGDNNYTLSERYVRASGKRNSKKEYSVNNGLWLSAKALCLGTIECLKQDNNVESIVLIDVYGQTKAF